MYIYLYIHIFGSSDLRIIAGGARDLIARMVASKYKTFSEDTTLADRVAVMAPIFTEMLESHDGGTMKQGVEAFNNEIMEMLDAAVLLERGKVLQVDRVGVHPDNREQSMLVPIDVQDLLLRMSHDGWNWSKWNALACGIPTNAEGAEWRCKNEALADGSAGLLAPYHGDALEVVTGRGSHGTAALRCAKFGAKSAHPELAGEDGHISASKLCERQPSFEAPLKQGCPYDVIPAALVIAVPRLMEILSRTGNAGNNVFREQTTLQHCNRIHSLYIGQIKTKSGTVNWDLISQQACIGMGPGFRDDAKKLCEFVKIWSGGEGAGILKEMEIYERTLSVKRKIYPTDMLELSRIELFEAQKYVPAMVKALLNAPTANSTGHATLFGKGDFTSLNFGGRNVPFAIDANKLMVAADKFLGAYARLPAATKTKLLSDLEVRCVMHVHQKRFDTRKTYNNLLEIAAQLHYEAKVVDPRLPNWQKLDGLCVEPAAKPEPITTLREIRKDGLIPDSELESRGFKVNAMLVDKEDTKWQITAFNQNLETVTLTEIPDSDSEHEAETRDVDRVELLGRWALHIDTGKVFCEDYPCPTTHTQLRCDIWAGAIKGAMVHEFAKTSEAHCKLQCGKHMKVVATKDFTRVGSFKLVGLTNSVAVVAKDVGGVCLCQCFEKDGRTYKAYAKGGLSFPTVAKSSGFARAAQEPFVVKFWACADTFDQSKANCVIEIAEVNVKISGASHTVGIPTITNSKPIKDGDPVVVLKVSKPDDTSDDEPTVKRAKIAKSKSAPAAKSANRTKGDGKRRPSHKAKDRS